MTDLMQRIRERDPKALMELYDQYGKLAYAVAVQTLHDASEAEDIVQEVFTTIWNDPGKFVERLGSLPSWLSQVVRNRAIDRLRSRNARARATQELAKRAETTTDHDASTAASPEDAEALQRVVSEIHRLPPEQKEIVELAYFGGLSQSQIADKLSQPLGTVKTRMRRAMERLRQALRAFAGGTEK